MCHPEPRRQRRISNWKGSWLLRSFASLRMTLGPRHRGVGGINAPPDPHRSLATLGMTKEECHAKTSVDPRVRNHRPGSKAGNDRLDALPETGQAGGA